MSISREPMVHGAARASREVTELIDPSSDSHFEFIRRAHERSLGAGLTHEAKVDIGPVASGSDLKIIVEKNRQLRSSALPFMETLHEQIMGTHSMVILTDSSGTVIEALGDNEFLQKAERVALMPGAAWNEETKGTNAIGTALVEEVPTVVHGKDHFLSVNHFLTCSAAPIFDPSGSALGVLDVTGDYRSYHQHTMGLVRMSAQMIENHLFHNSFKDAIIIKFHTRGEFLGSAAEATAAFSPDGKFLAANRVALIQFGMSLGALKMHTFSSLFGMPLSGLIDHYRACNPENLILCLNNGTQVVARAQLGTVGRGKIFNAASLAKASSIESASDTLTASTAKAVPFVKQTPCTNQRNLHLSSLKYLNTGDQQIAKVIEKVGKVIDKDIPILILGETGTGKEILAQAIHNDSPRQDKPFVAVNCASIPETLIESELFGYEDGAFTGAKKKGAQGKIMQANGGTLFLDEIGDMPMSLQARLLRVLQERVVTPLGSQKSYPVNLMVICATHRNLRDQIAQGLFREDLYYRLHGLVVRLPALRDRSDLPKIIERILENESENPDLTLDRDVLSAFREHSWPGNIRQLTNILRTASVMACDRPQISWDDLPDDFLDEYNESKISKTRSALASVSPLTSETQTNHLVEEQSEADTDVSNIAAKPRFTIRAKLGGEERHQMVNSGRVLTESQRPKFVINRHGSQRQTTMAKRFSADTQISQTVTTPNQATTGLSRFSVASKPVHPSPQDMRSQGYLASSRMAPPRPTSMNLEDMETQAIEEALEVCRGNVSAAARMLGISRNTIYRRLNAKQ